jgi:hypothetical protein
MYEKLIVDVWFELLQMDKHFIVKLSILDYFNTCPIDKLPKNYARILCEMSQARQYRIVKNQIYINLISTDEKNIKYKHLLLSSLKKTRDDNSIVRVLNTLSLFNSVNLAGEIKMAIRGLDLSVFSADSQSVILKKVQTV